MDESHQALIETTAGLIARSAYTVAFTGAGISTASGIPDFRSPGSGLWEKYDPFSVASLSAFRSTPERFFDWIKPLYLQSRNSAPNAAHTALASLEERGLLKAVITQNIDGLHQKAGSKNVIELHGSARTATCPICRKAFDGEELLSLYVETDTLPACPDCGKIIKPDVVLFEESLPQREWLKAEREVLNAHVILVIGSSLETYPANTLPRTGVQNGASLIINTISQTPLDHLADVVIQADVAEVVPQIVKLIPA